MKIFALIALALGLSIPSLSFAGPFDPQIVLSIDHSGKPKETITAKDAEKNRATLGDLKDALIQGEDEKFPMVPCYQGTPKEILELVKTLVENKDGNKVYREEIEPYLDLFRKSGHEYNILHTAFKGKKGKSHAITLVACGEDLKGKSEAHSSFLAMDEDDAPGI